MAGVVRNPILPILFPSFTCRFFHFQTIQKDDFTAWSPEQMEIRPDDWGFIDHQEMGVRFVVFFDNAYSRA